MVAVPGVAAVFVVLAVALVRRGAMFVIPRGVPKVCAASLVASMMARVIRTVFVLMIAMRTHTMRVYPPWVYFHQAPPRTKGCVDHYCDT